MPMTVLFIWRLELFNLGTWRDEFVTPYLIAWQSSYHRAMLWVLTAQASDSDLHERDGAFKLYHNYIMHRMVLEEVSNQWTHSI